MVYSAMLKAVLRARYGEPPAPTPGGAGSGLVLVADGVGGLDLAGTSLRYVMGAARSPHEVRCLGWGHGFGRWHSDLTNVTNHRTQAAALADAVQTARAEHPGAPVFLVGKSGGTGIVARALEALPADSIEAAVLLAPALSSGYDLSQALRAVRRELVVFWSPLDLIILGVGTRVFGTIDRVNAVSAGLVGFRPGPGVDPTALVKLRQVRWGPSMASTGYLGGHVGPDSPAFLRRYVVPLLRVADEPSAGDGPEIKPRAPRADNL